MLDESSFSLMSWHHIFCSFHQKIDFSWMISQKTLLKILYKVFAVLSFQKITLFPSETVVLIFIVNRMFLSTIKLNLFVFNWQNNELLYSPLVNTVLMFLFKPTYTTFRWVTSIKMVVRRWFCQISYPMTVLPTECRDTTFLLPSQKINSTEEFVKDSLYFFAFFKVFRKRLVDQNKTSWLPVHTLSIANVY